MKKSMLALVAGLPLALLAATSTPKGFTDDLDAALARAKDGGKYVYACFSGSDWCGWCIKLEKEVFSDDAFAAAVKDDYELVFIDSPRDKTRLSDHARAHNPELVKKYKIRGFPSMVVLDGRDGSEVTRASAYRRGGAAAYAEYLKKVRTTDFKKLAALEKEWIAPLEAKYEALMGELNTTCGKAIDAEAAKPENKGKRREELHGAAMPTVKTFLPRFSAIRDEAAEKAKTAPEEVREKLGALAKRLGSWVESIERQ